MLVREPPAEAVIRPAGPGRPEVPDHQPVPERPPRGAQPAGAGLHGAAAHRLWVSDITYRWTGNLLSLAVVLDLHTRSVVGWAMADRMTQDLVVAALAHGSRATWPGGPRRHHPFRPGQPVRLP